MLSTGSSVNGSIRAESGSGISSMSEASMPFQPAIEEPSKKWPLSNLSIVERLDRHRHVLLLAAGVGEAQVDEFNFVVF